MPTSSKLNSSSTTTPVLEQSASSTDPYDPTNILITHLSTTTTLEDLHTSLLSSLQRAGWTERVRGLALELLRGGQCKCFDEVVETVAGFASGNTHGGAVGRGRKRKRRTGRLAMENGVEDAGVNANINGSRNGKYIPRGSEDVGEDADEYEEGDGPSAITHQAHDGRDDSNNSIFTDVDVRIPEAVVGEGVKILREALDGILIFEDEDSNGCQSTSDEQQERGREPGGDSNLNRNSNSNCSGPRSGVKAPSGVNKSRSKPKCQENGETKKDRKGKGTR